MKEDDQERNNYKQSKRDAKTVMNNYKDKSIEIECGTLENNNEMSFKIGQDTPTTKHTDRVCVKNNENGDSLNAATDRVV